MACIRRTEMHSRLGGIILKWVSKKYIWKAWAGFILSGVGTRGRISKHGNAQYFQVNVPIQSTYDKRYYTLL